MGRYWPVESTEDLRRHIASCPRCRAGVYLQGDRIDEPWDLPLPLRRFVWLHLGYLDMTFCTSIGPHRCAVAGLAGNPASGPR